MQDNTEMLGEKLFWTNGWYPSCPNICVYVLSLVLIRRCEFSEPGWISGYVHSGMKCIIQYLYYQKLCLANIVVCVIRNISDHSNWLCMV